MRLLNWLDRNLWAVPTLVFAAVEAGLLVWLKFSSEAFLIASLTPVLRQPVYASLTGTASALLGFSITSVAILAAFGPRAPKTAAAQSAERRVSRARDQVLTSLLATSVFFLLLLIIATLGIATDTRRVGNPLINLLVLGSGSASLVGLLVSGAGVALVVTERNRAAP